GICMTPLPRDDRRHFSGLRPSGSTAGGKAAASPEVLLAEPPLAQHHGAVTERAARRRLARVVPSSGASDHVLQQRLGHGLQAMPMPGGTTILCAMLTSIVGLRPRNVQNHLLPHQNPPPYR